MEQPTVLDAAPIQRDRPQPTFHDRVPPTQWEQPRPQQQRAPQQWQQPQWQQEPQDTPGPQWPPQPPVQQPPVGGAPQPVRAPKRRRVRRSVIALFTVIVLLILLVIGDRVALAVTENQFASQVKSQGFPVKPSVTIEGFPFLTQLIAKDFNKVDISANNVPVPIPGGGSLTIDSVRATIDGLHISSLSSSANARVDHMTATAFVSFGALTAAGGIADGTGVTVTPAGPNTVKITAGLGGIASDTEEAQILQQGPRTIEIKVLPSGGLGSLLGSFGSFSFNLPNGVPPSLRITALTLNSRGLTVSASASNASFSQ